VQLEGGSRNVQDIPEEWNEQTRRRLTPDPPTLDVSVRPGLPQERRPEGHPPWTWSLSAVDEPSYAVLSSIFAFRYSTSAPRRRLGSAFTSRIRAIELTVRVPALQRVRKGCTDHLLADLWVIYNMCIEDDGLNTKHLDFSGAERWVDGIIRNITYPQPFDMDYGPSRRISLAILGRYGRPVHTSESDKTAQARVELTINPLPLSPFLPSGPLGI